MAGGCKDVQRKSRLTPLRGLCRGALVYDSSTRSAGHASTTFGKQVRRRTSAFPIYVGRSTKIASMSSMTTTVLPTPSARNIADFSPCGSGERRSMTLMPASKMGVAELRPCKGGTGPSIGHAGRVSGQRTASQDDLIGLATACGDKDRLHVASLWRCERQ